MVSPSFTEKLSSTKHGSTGLQPKIKILIKKKTIETLIMNRAKIWVDAMGSWENIALVLLHGFR